LADTIKDPAYAFRVSEQAVPSLKAQAPIQRKVLTRSLAFCRAQSGHALGWMDPKVWTITAQLLYKYKQIPQAVNAKPYYTNQFIR
jgi:hypothetical protein